MRVQSLTIPLLMIAMLIQFPGCVNQRRISGLRVDPRHMGQLRSLSLSGIRQASIVVGAMGYPREFRITNDGGQTWRMVSPQSAGGNFECATMIDNNRGWAVNNQGQVLTTNFAGANWRMLADPQGPSSGGFKINSCRQIEFVNETDGWLLGGLGIWRTRDGGVTWQETLSTLTAGVKGQPTRIYLLGENTLVSSGSDGQVYLTRDGGNSWKIKTLIPGGAAFTDVWFIDKQKGWLTGYIGGDSFRALLFQTKDGGESWEEIPLADNGITIRSVCFVDDEGWIAGDRQLNTGQSVSSEGVLQHTKDGGKHWTSVQLGVDDPFFSEVRFADRENGWLVARDNVYRTQDGGRTWTRVLSLPSPE